jgi:hypothetical protein
MHARGEVPLKVEQDANLATLQAVILGCTLDERRCVAWADAIMESKAGSGLAAGSDVVAIICIHECVSLRLKATRFRREPVPFARVVPSQLTAGRQRWQATFRFGPRKTGLKSA